MPAGCGPGYDAIWVIKIYKQDLHLLFQGYFPREAVIGKTRSHMTIWF